MRWILALCLFPLCVFSHLVNNSTERDKRHRYPLEHLSKDKNPGKYRINKANVRSVNRDIAQEDIPWFTGPLLAESGSVLPHQSILIQPFFVFSKQHGTAIYNPIFFLGAGFFKHFEIRLQVPVFYKKFAGAKSVGIGDIKSELGVQILRDQRYRWSPDFTMGFVQQFATGRYQNANIEKHGTDLRGSGAYEIGFNARLQKLLHVFSNKFMRVRFNIGLFFPKKMSIHGLSSYGGGGTTSGLYSPGMQISSILAFEQSFNRNWSFALDLSYSKQWLGHFKGKASPHFPVKTLGTTTYSIAPAIEYNMSQKLGFIAGIWQSLPVKAKKEGQFTRYILSIVIVL